MDNQTSSTTDYQAQAQGLRTWAIIATVLCVLIAGSSIWLWRKNSTLSDKTDTQEQQINSLEQQKALLNTQIDSLNLAYNAERAENDSLQGAVARAETLVAAKAAELNNLRRKTTRNAKELREQVSAMQKAKTELETVVTLLRTENEQLRAENSRLTDENQQLRGEKQTLSDQVSSLSQKLEDQIRKTQSAKFKATAFRVEVDRKGDKLTTRAKKVRQIMVSFDLADVPENYRGPQKLYLVIADDRGTPIPSSNPTKVTIEAPSGPIPIIAQQSKAINVTETQRLSFVYKLDERLQKGSYVAAIYCDKGLLGISSFRLN